MTFQKKTEFWGKILKFIIKYTQIKPFPYLNIPLRYSFMKYYLNRVNISSVMPYLSLASMIPVSYVEK